ncbi:hypothetical protein CYLTODRAFT_375933 [Cylindrobasidium torrendii FP15055 ss-10]|uniref:GYF domain-containing protein n=1 Tax=Cylindrobasidium torrendii FP15055 ss-10 TaxID=1314674 RepID=A0A0D7BAC4_9AGAR|nr:hypothetical protein CYLTODRAFT_375933 [Cylindrobasidium torrendii FP15055 ss-10]
MTASTMHFGPEWMRKQPAARTPAESGPPMNTAANLNASGYSLLQMPGGNQENREEDRPFRYSKEELLQIYRDGGGSNTLGADVERWDGVVRDVSLPPTAERDMTEVESKLFQTSLNSDLRRRQSTDFLSPLATQNLAGERPRLNHANSASGTGSPLRERFGGLARRRGESTDQIPTTLPRKLSLSSMQSPISPRDPGIPSPRVGRMATGFDGVLGSSGGDTSWSARRRASEATATPKTPGVYRDPGADILEQKIKEEDEPPIPQVLADPLTGVPLNAPPSRGTQNLEPSISRRDDVSNTAVNAPPPGLHDPSSAQWAYLDPQGNVQGPFPAETMQKWKGEGYFTPELLVKRDKLDTEWITVHELESRTTPGPLFLSPIRPPHPPGLPQHPIPPSTEPFATTFQPSPIRTIRSSTFDAFMGGSNPSDSPSSSVGAGRYSNASPDPNAFGGRGANYTGTPDLGRRNVFYDPAPIGHTTPSRAATLDNNFGYSPSGWPPQQHTNSFDAGVGGSIEPLQYPTFTEARRGSSSLVNPSPFVPLSREPTLDPQGATTPGYGGFQHGFPVQSAVLPEPTHASPWGNVNNNVGLESPLRRQFEAVNYPANAIDSPIQSSPWGTPSLSRATVAKIIDPSPWASVPSVPLPMAQEEKSPSTTVLTNTNGTPSERTTSVSLPPTPPEPVGQPSAERPAVVPASGKKARSTNKSSKPTLAISPTIAPAQPASPAVAPSPAVTTPSRPAWASEDSRQSSVSLSLREIQEAEAKKSAAERKEKERARQAAAALVAATAPVADEAQPVATSWGLPTSQAGTRTLAKDIASSPATTAAAPVWTTAAKATAKKTMKEIQEEEEARKKAAAKETPAAAAVRRAYAETTVKATPPPAAGGVWTTVGVGGKSATLGTAPAAPATPRATGTPAPTTPAAAPARPNGAATPSRTTTSASVPKAATPTAAVKVEEYPAAPSHEFLSWLNNSLQPLNKSVNVEEIMQMLLSFPVDPDSSTVELIAEMIYSNSTILDGRRFASEFVAKRKADALSRAKNGVNTSASKPVSIAEVVKAQPKPQGNEWGGFKVVNKKKKGGRA